MPEWMTDRQKRLDRIRQAKAALEVKAGDGQESPDGGGAEGAAAKPADKSQRNFTDPESRMLRTGDGFIQGWNAQAAADAGDQVIVAHGIANTGSDQDRMVPMLDAIERETGRLPDEPSADAGYCSEDNLKALEERGNRGYVATGRQRHGTKSATGSGPVRAGSRRAAMRLRLRRGDTTAARGCARSRSNLCSDRSSRPAASVSSCCVAAGG